MPRVSELHPTQMPSFIACSYLAEQTGEALAPGPLRKQVDRAVAP